MMRSVKIAISVHEPPKPAVHPRCFDWLMSRTQAPSQKTISLDLHKALDIGILGGAGGITRSIVGSEGTALYDDA